MNPFGYAFFSPYTVGYVLPAYYGGATGRTVSGGNIAHAGSGGGGRTSRGAVPTTASSPYRTANAAMISRGAANSARASMNAGSSGGFGGGSRGGWSGGGSSGAVRSAPVSTMSMGGGARSGGGSAHR